MHALAPRDAEKDRENVRERDLVRLLGTVEDSLDKDSDMVQGHQPHLSIPCGLGGIACPASQFGAHYEHFRS